MQRRACGESDEPENLKRREFLRFREGRNKQKQGCLKKERHCQEKLGVGSGEWGVGGRKLLSSPHFPFPTPHSLFARSANLGHRGDVTAARRGGQRVAGHPHV